MVHCTECGCEVINGICYCCGNIPDVYAIEGKLNRLAKATLYQPGTAKDAKGNKVCVKCNCKIDSSKCYYCGWNHKTQNEERLERPNFHRRGTVKRKSVDKKKEKFKTRQYTALAHPIDNNYGVPEWAKVRPNYTEKLVQSPTPAKGIFADCLKDSGIIFEYEKAFTKGGQIKTVDFYLETYTGNYVVEIDGNWHGKTIRKDTERSKWLLSNFDLSDVLRYWNWQVEDNPFLILEDIKALKPKYYDIPVMPQI